LRQVATAVGDLTGFALSWIVGCSYLEAGGHRCCGPLLNNMRQFVREQPLSFI
jgi:hypothetical protein